MRRNVLSLIVAFIAAIACFVLVPIIGLVLLRIVLPGLFEDDTLNWVLVFAGSALFSLLLTMTIITGFVAFFLSKAKLPDRGWRSTQTLVILLTFAATVAAAALITWPFFITMEPPEAGPQQAGLPTFHLARTLKATGNRSGTRQLAWSADGERIAAYGGTGIASWSPDDKYHKVFRIYQNFPTWDVLHYLSGHRLLITSPFAQLSSADKRSKLDDIAFSVVDAETGEVLQNIPGPHPGGRGPDNEAKVLAVTPDERFVASICGSAVPQINVYSTDDWKLVATIDLPTDERRSGRDDPRALAFSPDGKTLAVIGFTGRIKFFKSDSWAFSGALATYAEPNAPLLGALAFSPDGTMIAVSADSGGSWWTPQAGLISIPGSGTLRVYSPADPLRVYRISDGELVAALGSFPGGIYHDELLWSPSGGYIAFQDGHRDIRFWNPFQPNLSVKVARGAEVYSNLVFSKDGLQLAANFSDGLKVFDVVPPAK
jgi:WD40 repeat protein